MTPDTLNLAQRTKGGAKKAQTANKNRQKKQSKGQTMCSGRCPLQIQRDCLILLSFGTDADKITLAGQPAMDTVTYSKPLDATTEAGHVSEESSLPEAVVS
eukprot:COSAG01_NODE_37107_length_508_cov_1.000000_1_plen_101_part_00